MQKGVLASSLMSVALVVASGSAYAQGTTSEIRPYIGAGVGYSMIDTGVSNTTGTADLDENDLGFKGLVGVEFNKYISIEGFYANFGEASLTGRTNDTFRLDGTTYQFIAPGEISLSGWSVGAAANVGIPIHELFKPYAKLGFHRWEAELEVRSVNGRASATDDGFDAIFGGGVQSNITNNLSLRAEFERFMFDGEHVDMISASVLYRF